MDERIVGKDLKEKSCVIKKHRIKSYLQMPVSINFVSQNYFRRTFRLMNDGTLYSLFVVQQEYFLFAFQKFTTTTRLF